MVLRDITMSTLACHDETELKNECMKLVFAELSTRLQTAFQEELVREILTTRAELLRALRNEINRIFEESFRYLKATYGRRRERWRPHARWLRNTDDERPIFVYVYDAENKALYKTRVSGRDQAARVLDCLRASTCGRLLHHRHALGYSSKELFGDIGVHRMSLYVYERQGIKELDGCGICDSLM